MLWPSLVAQLAKSPAIEENLGSIRGWENPWRREGLPTPVQLKFHGQSMGWQRVGLAEQLSLSGGKHISIVRLVRILLKRGY